MQRKSATVAMWQVAGSAVATGLCSVALAQPANDTRANALPLPLSGSVTGTTVAANSEGSVTATCGSAANNRDVWYRFDATTTTGLRVSTCTGATWDTVVQGFLVGAGGALGALQACSDDVAGCGNGNQSSIDMPVTAGQSYYIRVTGWGSGNPTGPFTLVSTEFTPPPPPPPPPPTPPRTFGPDVTIGNISDVSAVGSATVNGVLSRGYGVGTDSWNIGDRPADWYDNTVAGNPLATIEKHPVIGQAMYRLRNGIFEQIGISFVKHGFLSTNSGGFPDMGSCVTPPDGGNQLGVNCSDLYGGGLNSSLSYLGPRFDVNATKGTFTFPWQPLMGTSTGGTIGRRLIVADADVQQATNPGAIYWVDAYYVTPDDSIWNNGRNNISTRRMASWPATSTAFTGATVRRESAIEQWPKVDSTVRLVNVDYHEATASIIDSHQPYAGPGTSTPRLPQAQWITRTFDIQARYQVASKVTNNGDGTWTYQYAVMNINSHRSGDNFRVRLPAGATVTNLEFSAPNYHSFDRVDNTPWTREAVDGTVRFGVDMSQSRSMTVPGINGGQPVPALQKAIRWHTMYNMRFTTNVAPTVGRASLGLHAAATPGEGYQGNELAVTGIQVPTICTPDVGSEGGAAGGDGLLDNNDFIVFIDAFFNANMLLADIGGEGGAAGADNILDNNDFIVFIDGFFTGCGS